MAGCVSSDDYEQQYYKKKREESQMGVGVVKTDSQRRAIMSVEKPDWSKLSESRRPREN
ncbi:hypothetical protein [Arsenophonus endosymbiont of Aleurodicus floccissimus]|uniref:hypothetical protein n=1 Tax=Arsenophonus endosymbiont of Aleurodicus floccissimus TaxID=2152761 RepID=UPI0016029947|nr:hypothetical protein [Arsenophonus endosymbiont of Aleurodicus floccissimus]